MGELTAEPGRTAAGAGPRRVLHLLFALVVASLFAWNATRLQFLGDDGYIAFRYAKNLAEGNGPVFNPGERVEGYTQPLWVLAIAAGIRAGIDPVTLAPVLGIACGALVLLVLPLWSRRVSGAADFTIWIAPLALAVNRTFCAWSSGGLGTQMFVLAVLASIVSFERAWSAPRRGTGRWRFLGPSLVFALATFARPEGGLFALCAGLFLCGALVKRRDRTAFADVLVFGLPYTAVVGVHLLWRHSYYGEWLPNTFYAKVSGFWWEQARVFLGLFAKDHLLLAVAPILVLLVASGRLVFAHRFVAAQCVAYLAYLAYVGGDRFEFRFMTPLLPLFYWLLQEGVRLGSERLARVQALRDFRVETAVALSLVVISTSALPLFTGFPCTRVETTGINCNERIGDYAQTRAEEGRFFRRLVEEGYLTGNELIATRGAGAMPYYSEFPILDLHGLNDARIAHRPIDQRGVIAHEKSATLEYVRERGVVICNVLNLFLFDEPPTFDPAMLHPWFPRPVRVVKAFGRYLAFGTTLDDEQFRRTFARFEIVK